MQKLPVDVKKVIQGFILEHPTAKMIKQLKFERIPRGERHGVWCDECLAVGKMKFRKVDFETTSWDDRYFWGDNEGAQKLLKEYNYVNKNSIPDIQFWIHL